MAFHAQRSPQGRAISPPCRENSGLPRSSRREDKLNRLTRNAKRLSEVTGRQINSAIRGHSQSPTLRSCDHHRQQSLALSEDTELLNNTILIQTLFRSVARGEPGPVLTAFRMPEKVLRSSGHYAPRVDKYTPGRNRLLLELIGDNTLTREQMLADRPVEVKENMGPEDAILQEQVTITDWMRSLTLEESGKLALLDLQATVLHELVRGPMEDVVDAPTRLVRVYRAQLVNGTCL